MAGQSEKNSNPVLRGVLAALGCEILFGFSYVFTKQAMGHASVLALLGWRFAVAFLMMGALSALGIVKIRLRGKPLQPLLRVALFVPVLYFIAETYGIRDTTASESGVFLACIPVASLAASALVLREKPTGRQVAGILVTLAGVVVTVIAVGVAASLSMKGYAMLTAAVLSYALYSVSVRKAQAYTGAEITFAMLACGAVVYGALAVGEAAVQGNLHGLVRLPFSDMRFMWAVLYQGIGCSVLAFFLSNAAIATIGVNRTASFIGVATVVSILAGVLLLNEPFSPVQMAGAFIILAGVYIANGKSPDTAL